MEDTMAKKKKRRLVKRAAAKKVVKKKSVPRASAKQPDDFKRVMNLLDEIHMHVSVIAEDLEELRERLPPKRYQIDDGAPPLDSGVPEPTEAAPSDEDPAFT